MGLRLAPVKEQDMHIGSPVAAGAVPANPAQMFPPGTVIAQNPPAGSRVDASTPIELTVVK
jgi:beta-lactam-binding protein with PASTA domain